MQGFRKKFSQIFTNITHTDAMTNENAKKKLSYALKCLTALSSLGGVTISLFESANHGYSHWSKRFLYFTAQSNLWIGLTMLALILYPLLGKTPPRFFYILKYVFTVSITVTGLVFCCLLGPFGDKSYHLWAFSSWLTHIFTPFFAIFDFFLDGEKIYLQGGHVWICALPPLFYSALTLLLEALYVDFGRGEFYPYFFLNYRSPVGVFGFAANIPFFAGSFYWISFLGLLVLGLGFLYKEWNNAQIKTSPR